VHYWRNLYGRGVLGEKRTESARARIRDASRRSIPNKAATSRQAKVRPSSDWAISSKIRGVRESQVGGRGILGVNLHWEWSLAESSAVR